MRKLLTITHVLFLIFAATSISFGQQDNSGKKPLKNTFRINLTNPIIFGENYLVLGYERVILPNQSASLNVGRFSLPKFSLINTGDLEIQKDYNDRGFHISFDYRFYLKSLNKYDAPRGVYLGPFYSYNHFNRENRWIYNSETFDGELTTDLSLDIHSVGVQLGYQFVFWRRLAVDLILFGPGAGFYGAKASLNTSLSPDEEAEFFQKLNELLAEKFPGYNQIITSTEFERKGSFQLTSLGFRYMIHLGFRF